MKKQKRMWLFYLASLPFCLLLGWVFGLLIHTGINVNGDLFQSILIGAESLAGKLGLGAGGVLWLLLCMMLKTQPQGLESGREYGEARFAPPEEVLPKIAIDKESDKVLGQVLRMGLDDKKTGYNASCLVIGGSGSGKTFYYVIPNLLQINSSFVLTDPKRAVF